jgi:hypothetical protein
MKVLNNYQFISQKQVLESFVSKSMKKKEEGEGEVEEGGGGEEETAN